MILTRYINCFYVLLIFRCILAQSPTKFTIGEVDFELDREFELMDTNDDKVVSQHEFDESQEQQDKDGSVIVEILQLIKVTAKNFKAYKAINYITKLF